MRSLLSTLTRRPQAAAAGTPPVPHSRSLIGGYSGGSQGDPARQLAAMGQVGTLFGIVHRTTTSSAAVEWHLYRKAASGKKEDRTEVTRHAALDLWRQPNPFFHRQSYVEMVQQHVDLTGKGYLVLNIQYGLPIEMWWARPDRMIPVPHPTKYLAGWIYRAPGGEKVPLDVTEVIPLRMPDPMDPFGGMGPVQALQSDLDSTRYAAEYNKMFFLNGAEPGGVVENPEEMDDEEFAQFQARWGEQHRGVSRAHRVALLEGGMHWVDRSTTQKDMQFVELRTTSRDTIMEAYTIHKAELGIAEDVNRANAEAGEVIFAKRLTVPRLERWKAALNWVLLPMYGATARDLEFDYESPVPEDHEQERADLTARIEAWSRLVEKGADPLGAAEAVGLPAIPMAGGETGATPEQAAVMVQKLYLGVGSIITWEEGRQILADAGVTQIDPTLPPPAAAAPRPFGSIPAHAERLDRPRAEVDDPTQVDHTATQAVWERLLDGLVVEWATITAAQRAELVAQIIAAVDAGDLPALSALSVDTEAAGVLLADQMAAMAAAAAAKVVDEAARQGVDGVEPVVPDRELLAREAGVTAALIGATLALSAGREAMRVQSPELSGRQVADLVDEFMTQLTPPRAELGGALTGAQNEARLETFRSAPAAALYADERMDANTCTKCREIDGRYIGLSDSAETTKEVARMYPFGGYVDCLGRARCRGTVTGVWRPQQAGGRR